MKGNMKQLIRGLVMVSPTMLAGGILAQSSVVYADPPPWAGGPHAERGHDDDRGYSSDRHERRHDRRDHGHFNVSTRERVYIKDWYRRHRPHGLAKKGKLPPGIAKKVYPGSSWPPPYEYRPLPPELVRDLQPLPSGYRYYEVSGAVVIADVAGQVVSDVVYDLLTR